MLIGTLPTLVNETALAQAEKMISHPLIASVRYNTGGDSPLEPLTILTKMKELTDRYNKVLYVDLEGRQLRIARWTPFDSGVVILNRDFNVNPPAKIFVRNAGWFDLVAANPAERKVYLENGPDLGNYYFGESQSVHVIGGDFKVVGYLGGLDDEYIKASKKLGIDCFMLSFVEEQTDLDGFYSRFTKKEKSKLSVVLKIESQKSVELIKNRRMPSNEQLMAARDDLFINFGDNPIGIIEALKKIISTDPKAIVASRILHGFQSSGVVTMGDISDVILMSKIGYKNFMFSDGIAKHFSRAVVIWEQLVPFLKKR